MSEPDTYYGVIDGGHCYQIVSETKISEVEAQRMAEEESQLKGWLFLKNGVLNSRGKYVYLLVREDQEQTSPDWKMLTKGMKP